MDPLKLPKQTERYDSREDYLETWRRTERFMERVGGIVFILAGGLLLTTQPVDPNEGSFAIIAVPVLIATGLALILRRRRIAVVRIHLSYLQPTQLNNRALSAGLGGALLLMLGVSSGMFTLFVVGALVAGLGLWYLWRRRKAQQYEALFGVSRPLQDASQAEADIEE